MTKKACLTQVIGNSWVETRLVNGGAMCGVRFIKRDGKLIQTVGSAPLWVGVCFLVFAPLVPFVPGIPLGLAVAAPIALLIGDAATIVGFYALKEYSPTYSFDKFDFLFDESGPMSSRPLGRVSYFQVVSRSVGLSPEYQLNAIINRTENGLDRKCLYASANRRHVLETARTYQDFSGLDLFDESTNIERNVPR